jgi:serine/threonine protein kinase
MLSDWFNRVFNPNDYKSSVSKSDGASDEALVSRANNDDGSARITREDEMQSTDLTAGKIPPAVIERESDSRKLADSLNQMKLKSPSRQTNVDVSNKTQIGSTIVSKPSHVNDPAPQSVSHNSTTNVSSSAQILPQKSESFLATTEQSKSRPTSTKASVLTSRKNFFGTFFTKSEPVKEVDVDQTIDECQEPKEISESVDSDGSEEVNLFTDPSHIAEDSQKPTLDDFSMIRVLGKGSYGKVVLVRKKSSQVLYAMKVLKKGDVVRKRQVERTKIERRVLGFIDHPFLMKLHFAFQTGNKLYLVLDYCPGGELFFHLSRYKRFPEGVVRFYSAQLVLALKHLHDGGIIYRDIKPENILLDSEGHIKLGDFGLAKDNITEAAFGAFSVCGTPEYMAPEVINKNGHGTCVDWWGLGMLMFEMLTGLPPWYTKDRQKLFERLRVAPLVFPKTVSPLSAGIIQGLLTRDPLRRLGAHGGQEVMDNPFFYGLDWEGLLSKRIPAPLNPCRNYSLNSESTHNFDPQFTRLPIDTIAQPEGNLVPSPTGDLNFDGFTYNDPCALYVADSNAMNAL